MSHLVAAIINLSKEAENATNVSESVGQTPTDRPTSPTESPAATAPPSEATENAISSPSPHWRFGALKTNTSAYVRSLMQHVLALVLISTAYVFSSLRRLSAIGMFAFDVSSWFLHLLQVCILISPTKVEIPLPLKCVQIAAGRHFCLGRMEGGLAVVSWGAGHFGQLGVGPGSVGGSGRSSNYKNSSSTSTTSENHLITFTPRPMIIERFLPHVIGSGVVSIAAGEWHGLALTESGGVWAWGSNRSLQCGRKHQHSDRRLSAGSSQQQQQAPTIAVPLPVPLEVPASKIAAGRSHSVAVARDTGQVYCWGSTNRGQCGNNVRRSTGIAPPRLVEGMSDLNICDIAAGGNHTVALTTGGRVFTWGSGSEGELGLGPAVPSQCKPRLVADLDFVAVAAGQEWKSQLQRARLQQQQQQQQPTTTTAAAAQTTKSSLSNVPTICKIFAAPSYSAALSTSGHVYVWGSNDAGQTGIPTPPCVPLKDGYNDYSSGSGGHTSSLRDLHVRTFDSRHNILLPTRIDAVADINVRLLACGPNHMWCIGEQRTPKNKDAVVVGQTLYEVQEVQRTKKLQRSREASVGKDCDGNGGDDLTDSSYDRALSSNPETAVESVAASLASASLSNNDNVDGVDFQKTDVASSPIYEKQVADIPLSPPGSKSPATKEKVTRRFSLRKVFTRMSSSRSLSGKDDTDHQSDMSSSKRSARSRRSRQDLDEVTA